MLLDSEYAELLDSEYAEPGWPVQRSVATAMGLTTIRQGGRDGAAWIDTRLRGHGRRCVAGRRVDAVATGTNELRIPGRAVGE